MKEKDSQGKPMESEANEVHEKIIEMKSLAGDLCTYCTQDCRDRLKILDSQIEALRGVINELAGEIAALKEPRQWHHQLP